MGILATGETAAINVKDIMTNAVNSAQGEMMGIIAIAVPAIVVVVVATVAVKFGLKWIRSIGKG